MKKIAIIPARGGSKRIPKKNIKTFLGKPIIAYSIEKALQSGLFDEVMVSTDDDEIADISEKYGATVPVLRSAENSDDFASTMDVLNEVVQYYHIHGVHFDHICCIYPTAPLLKIQHLKEGYKLLLEKNFNVVFPVVAFSYPIWRGLKREEGGQARMIWPENLYKRSQDLSSVFHDAGQWYWMNRAAVGGRILGDHSGSILLSEEEVQDIDTITDWRLAELKYELLQDTQ